MRIDEPATPPFRIIAIVSTADAARRVIASVASMERRLPMALMLRDPAHDPARVEALYADLVRDLAEAADLPLHIIANARPLPGVPRVHLPTAIAVEAEMPATDGARVGVSVHSVEEALSIHSSVEYLVASPVYPTASKPGHAGIGLGGLRAITAIARRPVFALGGITPERARECLGVGAYGVAGISLFERAVHLRALVDTIIESTRATSTDADH